jgi:hypothetical protein
VLNGLVLGLAFFVQELVLRQVIGYAVARDSLRDGDRDDKV